MITDKETWSEVSAILEGNQRLIKRRADNSGQI